MNDADSIHPETDASAAQPTQSLAPADQLVMAMPRKDLYTISGFTTRIDLNIIESLAEDVWFAAAASLVNNFDAKEVSLGLVVTRGDQVLVDESGCLLHTTRIGPEISRLGRGLKALRDLARLAGAHFLGVDQVPCEMIGYVNDDTLPSHRHAFFVVYRCRVPDDVDPPSGLSFVSARHLPSMPLDPVSIVVAGELFPASTPRS